MSAEGTTIRLAFMGQVQSSLIETGKQMRQVSLILVLGSICLLGVSLGKLSISKDLLFLGVTVSVPNWAYVYFGMIVILLFLIALIGLIEHEERLRYILTAGYQGLGIESDWIGDEEAFPLESPNALTASLNSRALSEKAFGLPLSVFYFLFVALFVGTISLGSLIAALYSLVSNYGMRFWTVAPSGLFILMTFLRILLFFRSFFEENTHA